MGNAPRKLLTTHRKLLVDIKRYCSVLSQCKSSKSLELESLNYYSVKLASDEFINNLKSLHDEEQLRQLSCDVIDRMRRCSDLYQTLKQRFNGDKCDGNSEDEPCPDVIIDVEPTDSISQVASRYTVTSSKSSLIKLVELERKLRLVAEAEARKSEAEACRDKAEADARNARLLAEVEEAEALAQMRLKSINLKAEEKLMALSQRGSSAMTLTKSSKIKSHARACLGVDRRTDSVKFQTEVKFEKRLLAQQIPAVSTTLDPNAKP